MTDLPIGSLWRSRQDATNMRIITYIQPARIYGPKVYFVEYYSPAHGCKMTTVSSLGEWFHHFISIDT